MARIILEDIKLNKNTKLVIPKKNTNSFVDETEDIDNLPIIRKKEIKIDKYLEDSLIEDQEFVVKDKKVKNHVILHKSTGVVFILCLVVGLFYWGGNIFEKTIIHIVPKKETINYNNEKFTALKDSNVNFEIMIKSEKISKKIILTESKKVSIKAEGVVTLYNEFSMNPQKIIAGTFLSDDDGRVYNTKNAVIIPGYKKDNQKIIPGQSFVEVTAFLTGEAYNGSPKNFYINSFKGNTKYDKIYGKLNKPFTGGMEGFVYVLDDSNKENIDNIVKTSLKENLLKQVKSLVPEEYILYPGASIFSYKIPDNISSKTPETEIEIDGTLSVILLKEKSLVDSIIKNSFGDVSKEEFKEIKIQDLSNLSFNFTNKNQSIEKETNSIPFSLSGDIVFIWEPNQELLKIKLIGVNKKDVLPIFKQDPGIVSASTKILPPWKEFISDDLSKIKIVID